MENKLRKNKIRKKVTLIVGNGLGRCLSPESYNLESAMKTVWKSLEENERKILNLCLKNPSENGPQSESELDNLHKISIAAKSICELVPNNFRAFITKELQEIPSFANYYRFKVATTLAAIQDQKAFKKKCEDKLELLDSFTEWIIKNNCSYDINVATLNYDRLLYGRLMGKKGLKGNLYFDGFISGGFSSDKRKKQSYYLHLHGTPLIWITDKGTAFKKVSPVEVEQLRKLSYEAFKKNYSDCYFPIILNNEKEKSPWIHSDPVLRIQFERFRKSLSESEIIISLGYSSGDSHVNAEIEYALNDGATSKRFIYCHHSREKGAKGIKSTELYKNKKSLIETREYKGISDWVDIVSDLLTP